MWSNSRTALLLVLALAGCARWHPQGLTPQAVIERERPSRVRVIRTDSSCLEMRSPVIEGDSIRGLTRSGEVAVPLDGISYLSLKGSNSAGVAAMAGIGVATGLIVLFAATWN
jgi:hypothetical protein